LNWVVTGGIPYFDETWEALDILRRDYVTDKRMSLVCVRARVYRLFYGPTEDLLRAVSEKNPDRQVRAVAIFTLAGVLRDYVRLVRHAKDPSTVAGSWQNDYPKELVRKVENWQPDRLLKEVEEHYREAADKYGDVEVPGRTASCGSLAKAALFEVQRLQPGMPAPDITGTDLEGAGIKLSEHRGKVVLLVFWASWCGPCMARVPAEREIVAKFKDRPFVLVGVNGDPKIENARNAVTKHQIPWRSFWNGKDGYDGPISLGWNIEGWPTEYLLDGKGVIRHRNPDRSKLDALIAGLLEEPTKPGR
jgi:thiol-disulfide isomerase/thioredoxin